MFRLLGAKSLIVAAGMFTTLSLTGSSVEAGHHYRSRSHSRPAYYRPAYARSCYAPVYARPVYVEPAVTYVRPSCATPVYPTYGYPSYPSYRTVEVVQPVQPTYTVYERPNYYYRPVSSFGFHYGRYGGHSNWSGGFTIRR